MVLVSDWVLYAACECCTFHRSLNTGTMVVSTNSFWVGVDAVTTAWVFALRHKSFSFLALAMFFPGIAALGVEATAGDLPAFLRSAARCLVCPAPAPPPCLCPSSSA